MTKYEKMIKKANESLEKALITTDLELRIFYFNASKGLKFIASNLTVEEAGEIEMFGLQELKI